MTLHGSLGRLRERLAGTPDLDRKFELVSEFLLDTLGAFECIVVTYRNAFPVVGAARSQHLQLLPELVSFPGPQLTFAGELLDLPCVTGLPFVAGLPDCQEDQRGGFTLSQIEALQRRGIHWCAAVPITTHQSPRGSIILCREEAPEGFDVREALALQQVADVLSMELVCHECGLRARTPSSGSSAVHDHAALSDHGKFLIVRADRQFRIEQVRGDAQKILGLTPEQIVGDNTVWKRLIPARDRRRLIAAIASLRRDPRDLSLEVRVVHQATKETRWILLRGIPVGEPEAESYWEGFGLDITAQRQSLVQLESEQARLAALYKVAQSLTIHRDPALLLLRGMKALIDATRSDAGFACFYNDHTQALEVVATHGLTEGYLESLSGILNRQSLVRYAVTHRQGLLRSDLTKDPNASTSPAVQEGFRSAVVMPLLVEDLVLGALVLFSRKVGRYRRPDFELVSAAASQISLAARQSLGYASERQHAKTLAAMYRVSQALAGAGTFEEILDRVFETLDEECPSKRLWFGMLNAKGTHLEGRAGRGPGVTSRVTRLQIALGQPHGPLEHLLASGEPQVLECSNVTECGTLTRLLQVLRPKILILVPVAAFGEKIGVLVVEPASRSVFAARSQLPILSSLAGEIGSAIIARRHQETVSASEKMRVAEVLSSGIAHNFNNLLQAIMGQASLIQMQAPSDSALSASARMIIDAAGRGAALVGQLRRLGGGEREFHGVVSVTDVIRRLVSSAREFLDQIELSVELPPDDALQIVGDENDVSQALTNLLKNARDAVLLRRAERSGPCTIRLTALRSRVTALEGGADLDPGEYVRVVVEDNGIGMDAEQRARCFEPFFSTKTMGPSGPGVGSVGLGLSTAFSIVRHHGGIITVTSELGRGSTFTVFFPVKSETNVLIHPAAGTRGPSGAISGSAAISLNEEEEFLDDEE